MGSPPQKGPKLGGFRGSSLAQAIQGNFDHIMAFAREVMRAHNLVVDDIESLADQGSAHTNLLGQHEGTLEDHETRIVDVEDEVITLGDDAATERSRNNRKPPGMYYDRDEDAVWLPPKGDKGDKGDTGLTGGTGSAGSAGAPVPWPGDDGEDGFTFPGRPGDTGAQGNPGADGAAGSGTGGSSFPGLVHEDDDPWGMWVPPTPPVATGTSTRTGKWFHTPADGNIDDGTRVSAGTSSPDLADEWAFADAAQQGVYLNTAVPFDYATGTIEVFLWWWTGTSTGNVRWLLSVSDLAVGDSIGEVSDLLAASATVVADSLTIKRTSLGTFTPAAAGDLLKVNLERNGSAGTDTATGAARVAAIEFVYTQTVQGGVGPTGATGAAGQAGTTGVPAMFTEEYEDPFPFSPLPTNTDTDTQKFNFPYNLCDGQQYPGIPMRACQVTGYRGYSDYARNSDITIDVKKNGSTVFSSATKPKLVAAGGADTARAPDTTSWADGDIMTIHLSGSNGNGPAVLTMRVVYI